MVTNRDRSSISLVVHYSVLRPFVIQVIENSHMIVDSTEARDVLLLIALYASSATSQEARLSSLLLQSCLVSP